MALPLLRRGCSLLSLYDNGAAFGSIDDDKCARIVSVLVDTLQRAQDVIMHVFRHRDIVESSTIDCELNVHMRRVCRVSGYEEPVLEPVFRGAASVVHSQFATVNAGIPIPIGLRGVDGGATRGVRSSCHARVWGHDGAHVCATVALAVGVREAGHAKASGYEEPGLEPAAARFFRATVVRPMAVKARCVCASARAAGSAHAAS